MASTIDENNVAAFVSITSSNEEQARFYLSSSNDILETALSNYFEANTNPGLPSTTAADSPMANPESYENEGEDEDEDMVEGALAQDSIFQDLLRRGDMEGMRDYVDSLSNPPATTGSTPVRPAAVAPVAAAASTGRSWGAGNTLSGTSSGTPVATSSAAAASSSAAPVNSSSWHTSSSTSSSSSSRSATPLNPMRSNQPARVSTLRDLGGSAPSAPQGRRGGGGFGGSGRVAANDDDDDDEGNDSDKEQLEFFTGGEKSGLSVENPNARRGAGSAKANDAIKNILQKAKDAGARIAGEKSQAATQGRSIFSGSANTLGSDDTPSTHIPRAGAPGNRVPGSFPGAAENEAEEDDEETRVDRHLIFWEDGFSIEDGDLLRYEDPANAQVLADINAGRAPLSLLNIQNGQLVQLVIQKRLKEKWVRQPTPDAGPFAGSGNRLGATATTATAAIVSVPVVANSDERREISTSTTFEVDPNAPVTSLQLRLRDGTRMVARFNHTHTVGDIRRYINASAAGQSAYALQTTFPSRDLTDDTQTLKDANLLGSVVVQRGI